jgi:phenylalanine-4-hydroxylase
MNDILAKIGWGAVAVDGFIPPAAFMEFQAYKVLVIACDMRQIHHIEYTPAPDIVHEAAGHAPIIVDREYSEYLQRFGEVGAKAMSSKKDFELYQAVRHLSILKEQPNADPKEVDEATKLVEHRQKTLGEPSEMALLSRLHWWTVEYGLIGTLENPKIYGAGLLSSIGESVSCLEPAVEKIPYSIDAQTCAFDITTKQPQLFVCRDFQHLKGVLGEFASKMAYQVGGLEGINKAIECQNVTTCEYSSGLQLSGIFTEVITDNNDSPIYLRTAGKTALAFRDQELERHGVDYHKDGFGSPVGKWKQASASPELLTNDQLHALGIVEGRKAKIEFGSGVEVSGKVDNILRRDGKLLLITFSSCTAKYGDRVLFNPDWGMYDMAIGERISSVFNGAADKDAYNQVALVPKERTIKVPSDAKRKRLENLYAQVRKIRESQAGYERLGEIWETQQAQHPEDWLLSMEVFEILDSTDQQRELRTKIEKFLNDKKTKTKDLSTLIGWGFRLVDYHKKPEYQGALQASPE